MSWQENGLKQFRAFMDKIEGKLTDGKKLTGFERSLYRVETGLVDYSDADAGMGPKGNDWDGIRHV